jgi:hypothetical protein
MWFLFSFSFLFDVVDPGPYEPACPLSSCMQRLQIHAFAWDSNNKLQ